MAGSRYVDAIVTCAECGGFTFRITAEVRTPQLRVREITADEISESSASQHWELVTVCTSCARRSELPVGRPR